MKKQKGFTLIELMIVIAIIGIFLAIIVGPKMAGADISTRCIGGYTHNAVTGAQIFDKSGVGIPCGAAQ